MKKNYIYFLAPLVGLLIFGAVYWNFSKGLAAREAARIAAEKQKKEDKLRKQARDNEQAIKEALAAQAKRKAEREAKEAKDKADKEARALAVEARDKADRDARKLTQQVERLEKAGVKTLEASVSRIPQNTVEVTEEKPAKALLKLLESLEDHDDVQSVHANFDIDDELMERLS